MRYVLAFLILSLSFASAQSDTQEPAHPLRDSTLSQSDRLALQHALQKSTGHAKLSEDEILNTEIRSIDLNEDDDPEIVAQSAKCDAIGNCPLLIFQKKGTAFKLLLRSIAKDFRIRTIKTGGFADVELGQRDSDYRTEWRGYKYDGSHYVKVKCWANVIGDEEHTFPKPKVEPCKKR